MQGDVVDVLSLTLSCEFISEITSNTSSGCKMCQQTMLQKQHLNTLFSSAVCSFTVIIGLVIRMSILKCRGGIWAMKARKEGF